jgi:3-methyladenine DNA glycosylase Tag
LAGATIVSFQAVHEAALLRYGSEALQALLSKPASLDALRAMPEDRYLSTFSLRIFRAGLKHEMVDRKWPAFEEVFAGFDVQRCATMPDERIEELLGDARLIRSLPKLRAVRHNAAAILELRGEGGIGAWIAGWPVERITELWETLASRFSQMGGSSAPYALRMLGKDTFILTPAVVKGLNYWQAFEGEPKSKSDRKQVQAVFNRWHEESGLPLCQVSQILARSTD